MTSFPPPYAVDVALSVRSHERIGDRRTDEAWLAEQWADGATRVLVLAGGRFPLESGGTVVRWLSPREADDLVPGAERVLLGERDGLVHFVAFPAGFRAPEDWGMLRSHGPGLSAADQGFVVQAVSLDEWRRSHRFCGRCGHALDSSGGGYVLTCPQCGRHHFPRTDPAVIMLVTDDDGRALLGRQPSWPAGRFSTLAGFVDPGESLEDAVRREVMEEAGIEVGEVAYFGNQPWPFPSSLMVGFFGRALTTDIHVDDDELEAARWFTRDDVRRGGESGELVTPGGFSISRSLVEAWFGGTVPGSW